MDVKEGSKNKIFKYIFLTMLAVKLLVLGMFSSDYQNILFIPFVSHFVEFFDNPWNWAYQTNASVEFPYHPLMLYAFSPGAFLIKLFHINNIFLSNFLFKIPILLADLGIFYLFLKSTKNKYCCLIYYFCSPVILWASYMHSQLDIVPVAILFYSFYLLKRKKINQATIWFSAACCFKLNAILLLMIFLIYLYKNSDKTKAILSALYFSVIYFLISAPFILSEGYQKLVLFNPKQNLFFNLQVDLGQVAIYIPLLCVLLLYFRFMSYKKINNSLLDSFCCLVISTFLIFIKPASPAWHIWLIPFIVLFVINFSQKNKYILPVYVMLNIVYLVYFIFFHIGDYCDLTFLSHTINLKINNEFLSNCVFTLLESIMISIIYLTYKIAIKSNSIYKKERAVLIGISGDSGAGKTTLLNDLQMVLGDNLLALEGDGAHKWERKSQNWNQYTHLDPRANFLHQQMEMLNSLKNFKTTFYREYDHNSGCFEINQKVQPRQFIALSGLHTFYLPKMRKILDLKIYLDTQKELQKCWKTQRDIKERGHKKDKIAQSIIKREKDAIKHIAPQKAFADIIINYFVDDISILTKGGGKPNFLKLRIDFDSSICIEKLSAFLKKKNACFEWDYSDDLKTQYIILHSQKGLDGFFDIIEKQIDNADEILCPNFHFFDGYRGIIQFILLMILASKMKENND